MILSIDVTAELIAAGPSRRSRFAAIERALLAAVDDAGLPRGATAIVGARSASLEWDGPGLGRYRAAFSEPCPALRDATRGLDDGTLGPTRIELEFPSLRPPGGGAR